MQLFLFYFIFVFHEGLFMKKLTYCGNVSSVRVVTLLSHVSKTYYSFASQRVFLSVLNGKTLT